MVFARAAAPAMRSLYCNALQSLRPIMGSMRCLSTTDGVRPRRPGGAVGCTARLRRPWQTR
eukprot:148950-Chlamydomonas_euryale.AAC.1